MNTEQLQQLGLTKSQAKAYIALIQNGELTPPQLADKIKESRTNAYMILDKLESLNLIEKTSTTPKLVYQPLNPVQLEKLAEEQSHKVAEAEEQIKRAMPNLLSFFYAFTEKPGVRLMQGKKGLKEIYQDTLRTKEDVYFIRTPVEVETLGDEFFQNYQQRRAFLGMKTYSLTQDTPEARERAKSDELYNKERTWIDAEDYTAPVEIDIYGDKVALMAYGEDIMGVIIQSPHIAEAMRQILKMTGKYAGAAHTKEKTKTKATAR